MLLLIHESNVLNYCTHSALRQGTAATMTFLPFSNTFACILSVKLTPFAKLFGKNRTANLSYVDDIPAL